MNEKLAKFVKIVFQKESKRILTSSASRLCRQSAVMENHF